MSFICESGIGHAVGCIAEVVFNTYTKNNYPVLSYTLHEFIIEPAIDYKICHKSPDSQQITETINNYSLQDTTLYLAEFFVIYQASVAINAAVALYLGVNIVPIIPAIILATPFVLISSKLISSGFSYIPSIIDEISLLGNNTSHLRMDGYIHPCAPRYGTDIFHQNSTEIEKETFILLQDHYEFL
jgi:hypothetical protein